MDEPILSQAQMNIVDRVLEWLKTDEQTLVIGGYAGTGKTTISKYLQSKLGCITFAAYTGKAVNVLRSKGCNNVHTIHSLIYQPVELDKAPLKAKIAEIEEAEKIGDKFLLNRLRKDYLELEEKLHQPAFKLRLDVNGGGFIIVDEYSMLDEDIVRDLLKNYKKILFMGDPFQLPPVNGVCPLRPAVVLNEIHRQAGDSGIIQYATKIRNMEYFGFCETPDFAYCPWDSVPDDEAAAYDVIICGRNKTRQQLNAWKRRFIGIDRTLPIAGEQMMCLRNNKDLEIFNGMTMTVQEDAHKMRDEDIKYMVKFNELKEEISVWEGDIKGEQFKWANPRVRGLQRFDFCHAITAHKSQGSEYNYVLVVKEPIGDDEVMRARWMYTAITRGKKGVKLVMQ